MASRIPSLRTDVAGLPGTRPTALLRLVQQTFRPVPPFVAGRLMNRCLRLAGLSIGKTSCFWGMPEFSGTPERYLEIGDHCGFNARCYFDARAPIRIADHVSVGQEVMFLARPPERTRTVDETSGDDASAISVGEGAWIGARSIILPGVNIGPGSVVSAGTVVERDVPAQTLLSGTRRISLAKWR